MPEKIAFLFPGQGSQYIGMGRDFVVEFPEAKEIFDQVDDICQKPISKFCFEGPMDELTLTINLQPAVTAVNLVCLAALSRSGISPYVSAGHSLGEYAALASAGVISAYDALLLTKERGALMHRESLERPGLMAAIVGMDIDGIEKIVRKAKEKGEVAVANHNTAEQIVITGEQEPLAEAVSLVKEKGAKAIPLNVSGAWHCSLMENAVDDLRQFMEDIPFSEPATALLFNATAESETKPEQIKSIMAQQLVSPVKWYDINMKMLADGIDTIVEVGPKKVLSGLLKKNVPKEKEINSFNVGDVNTLNRFLEAVGK